MTGCWLAGWLVDHQVENDENDYDNVGIGLFNPSFSQKKKMRYISFVMVFFFICTEKLVLEKKIDWKTLMFFFRRRFTFKISKGV